jgi:predicted dehydrogenase
MRVTVLGHAHPQGQAYLRAVQTFPEMEVASAPPFDAAIVCAPELIEQAAAPVILCEIPFAPTVAQAENVIGACRAQDAKLYPALSLRFLPVFKSLKQMLVKNELGQILSLKVKYETRRLADAAANPLIANIMQAVDLLRWLLDTEITDLYSEAGSGLLHSGNAVDDAAILSVMLANGAYATLDVSQSLPPTYPAPEDLNLEVIGTGGWARVDAYRQKIDTYARDGFMWANWGSDRLTELLRGMVSLTLATSDDALRAQVAAISALESKRRE